LTASLHRLGVRVAIDTNGPLLRDALAAGPDLVKPNRRELAEASGCSVGGPEEALVAIERLRAAGARSVLASLGAEGGLLVDHSGAFHATAAVPTPRSTVGAGDAMLAGFLAAGGYGPAALAEAVAWGSAAVSLPGSRMPGRQDIDRSAVRVNTLRVVEVLS
jgi:1-phosphofructokinase